ncbi:C3 and PZP-like alpha-2-macroglobulin domain-containing protein 8, partial [Saccoglossus kowalevskii]
FWVKTANDVDIALATAPSDNSDKEYYRIGIGAIFNTEVHAYSMWSYDNRVVKKINGLLSQSEYMGFWITWNNGHIKLGKAGRKSQILEYQDNAKIPLTVNYIGYSTAFGSPGEFLLYSH